MKDVVMLLSNIASEVVLPGKEQAFCLLQFLLAFTPSPAPTLLSDPVFFTSYDPGLHPYLPYAVDALAKLLARDEPNRTFYRTIFAADALHPSSPSELLTRAFALAIAPIPPPGPLPMPTPDSRDPRLADAYDTRPSNLPPLVEVRKPFLMQGLLTADILASLAPGHESGVARAWLGCGNGFAQNLFLLIRQLSTQYEVMASRGNGPHQRGQPRRDSELVYIVRLAVSMLRRLCEKARDPSDPTGKNRIPATALPSRENLLGALQMHAQEWTKEGMLADLVAFASLEE
jgi:SWI/SNF chromatin-remodeling complex subunit SWI1